MPAVETRNSTTHPGRAQRDFDRDRFYAPLRKRSALSQPELLGRIAAERGIKLRVALKIFEHAWLAGAVFDHSGNVSAAARHAGYERSSFSRMFNANREPPRASKREERT
jgi:hypothetical protein